MSRFNIQQHSSSSEETFKDKERLEEDENFSEDEETRKMRKEVVRQREAIHRERQKREGILPEDIKRHDFIYSLTIGNSAPGAVDSFEQDKSILSKIVISEDNMLAQIWRVIYIFSCLTSCYFYAFIAAFGVPTEDETYELWIIYITYECIFGISICLEFIKEYKPQGEMSKPVRDIGLIS